MSPGPLVLLGVGLLLGLRHAAEADHVVAVTAIAARTRRVLPALWLGVLWGLGHSLTLWLAGAGIILLRLAVPPRLELGLELLVAVTLIALGIANLRAGARRPATRAEESLPAGRALVVGMVHGLAGSAAAALLVLTTVADPVWACAYLAVLAAGTLLGMALITLGIASPLRLLGTRAAAGPVVRLATGTLSVALGAWLAFRIGWVEGFFRGG